jgi:hypothetical protein
MQRRGKPEVALIPSQDNDRIANSQRKKKKLFVIIFSCFVSLHSKFQGKRRKIMVAMWPNSAKLFGLFLKLLGSVHK